MLIKKNHYSEDRDLSINRKQVSEYAMAFDLLSKITRSGTEKETIESILQAFVILFSPRKSLYVSLKDGQPEHIYTSLFLAEDKTVIKSRLSKLSKKYAWTESDKGFQIKVSYNGNDLGILEVDEIMFPEYKEHYLNLTMSMIDVCGLAIVSAKRYQQLKDAGDELRKEKEKLEDALSEIRQLSGLVPICSHCKSIRDDNGYWNRVESYIALKPEADLSHGICPVCAKKYYPDIELYDE